jgi:hypothetical protein
MKCGEFLDELRNCTLIMKDSASWSWCGDDVMTVRYVRKWSRFFESGRTCMMIAPVGPRVKER